MAGEGRGQLITVLRHQHGFSRQPSPQTFTWSLMITRALDINVDPSCSKTMEPDTVLGGSLGPDIPMASGGSTSHSGQFGPQQQHAPHPAPDIITRASGGRHDHEHPNGPQ